MAAISPDAPSYESLTPPGPPSSSHNIKETPPPLNARLSALENKLGIFASLETKIEALSQLFLRANPALSNPTQNSTPHEDEEEEDYYSSSESDSPPVSPRYEGRLLPDAPLNKQLPDIWASQEGPDPDSINFDPVIIQQEPDIPEPCPRIRAHLAACHLWGQEGWNRTQYKDTEKKLKHAGGFQPLLVNHQLAPRGRDDFYLRQTERILKSVHSQRSSHKALAQKHSSFGNSPLC